MSEKVDCPICGGTGVSPRAPAKSAAEWPCVPCRGTGKVDPEKVEEIKERYSDG